MSESPGQTLVFVYGTLMRGEANHGLLARARYLGEAQTHSDFALVDMGEYPAMVYPGEEAVVGEVYAVGPGMLDALDELEDHPSFYRRTPVTLADGREAQAYVLAPSLAAGSPAILGADWRAYSRHPKSA